jgi:hypothetical protein
MRDGVTGYLTPGIILPPAGVDRNCRHFLEIRNDQAVGEGETATRLELWVIERTMMRCGNRGWQLRDNAEHIHLSLQSPILAIAHNRSRPGIYIVIVEEGTELCVNTIGRGLKKGKLTEGPELNTSEVTPLGPIRHSGQQGEMGCDICCVPVYHLGCN